MTTVKSTDCLIIKRTALSMTILAMAPNTTCMMTTAGPIWSGATTIFQDASMKIAVPLMDTLMMELIILHTIPTILSLTYSMLKCTAVKETLSRPGE